MQKPAEITFKNFEPAAHVRERVAREAERLDRFHPAVVGCKVVVERVTSRRRKGDLYKARIHVSLPGGKDVAVTRNQDDAHAHEDVLVAVRDAFDAAQRQIEDIARTQRGDVKTHEPSPTGRVVRFLADAGAGFIETDDGRELYFHRNSVVDGSFDRLKVGDRVRFHEELGADGPQASTVAPAGGHRRS
jgi:cold shock CspA family protein/ribosome-associated translation inhibitor RaiA